MDDLIAFVRARLDEDERVARAASTPNSLPPGSWAFTDMQIRDAAGCLVVKHTWPAEGEHIARHDPARALLEVETKRRNLASLEQAHGNAETAAHEGHAGDSAMYFGMVSALLDVAKANAQVYAAPPDSREEWKP